MNDTSPLLALPQAVDYASMQDSMPATDLAGVAWHYGNPLGEQRVLETSPSFVDLSHRQILSVTGPDAPEFLHKLLSQQLIDAPTNKPRLALDLDAQGHILHMLRVIPTADGFYLDLAPSQAQSLQTYLERMIFWSQVEIATTDLARLHVHSSIQPAGDLVYAAGPEHWDVYVPRTQLRAYVDATELRPVGLMAYTAARVRQLEPELSLDIDAKTIPHEIPHFIGRGEHVGAVHLEKGCYRGQETVARVENLGRAPRQLVLVHLDGSAPELPEPGADIFSGKRRVGRLGTVVQDYEYGPIALALVKHSALRANLQVAEMDIAVDPDSLQVTQSEQRGKQAIAKLRGQ
ncbi:MAG: folate-binding protein [Corynebacterium sp.]|nr:folate-binding protein [Corynebacterium sp.]